MRESERRVMSGSQLYIAPKDLYAEGGFGETWWQLLPHSSGHVWLRGNIIGVARDQIQERVAGDANGWYTMAWARLMDGLAALFEERRWDMGPTVLHSKLEVMAVFVHNRKGRLLPQTCEASGHMVACMSIPQRILKLAGVQT